MGFWDKYGISPVGKVVLGAIGVSALSRAMEQPTPTVVVVRGDKPRRSTKATGKKSRKERLKELIHEAEIELAKEEEE